MSESGGSVGVVGLGLIGGAVVRRLAGAGFSVAGYDIDPQKAAALAALGIRQAASLCDLGAMCERFVIAVFDTAQVEDVLEGPGGLIEAAPISRGKTCVCVSTCDPERIAALGERLRARGVALVECPLSGTSAQVADGEAVGLVAGDEAAIAGVADVLAALCKRRHFLGALGNGNRAKLAVNLTLGLNRAALAEGLVLAERLGLPLDSFLDVARGSAAYSAVMDQKGAKMIGREFSPQGRIAQSHKDFSLILAIAQSAGQELPFAALYRALLEDCIELGAGGLDNSAIIEAIRRRSVRPPHAL